jgi:FdrA protein
MAHLNPAGELAPALERAAADGVVVARVCGTPNDPQDGVRQAAALREAGALVAPSNACAARLALRAVR